MRKANPKLYNQANKNVNNSRSVLNLSDLNVKYSNLDNYMSPNRGSQYIKGIDRSRMNTIEPSSTDFGQGGSPMENSIDSPKK